MPQIPEITEGMTHEPMDLSSVSNSLQISSSSPDDQRRLSVGLDPAQVQAREDGLMAEANAAVHAAREHAHAIENQAQQVVHSVRSEAQSTVQEAHAHVRSIESRAHSVMDEMQECHRQELAEAQRIANQAHAESSQRLVEADIRIQQLLGMIDSQAQQLEAQRKEQERLAAQVSLLQNELTMLRHAAPSCIFL